MIHEKCCQLPGYRKTIKNNETVTKIKAVVQLFRTNSGNLANLIMEPEKIWGLGLSRLGYTSEKLDD